MSFLHHLTEKPWLPLQKGAAGDLHDGGPLFALPTAKIGLRVFLVVVSVVFSLLIVTYNERMELGDWRPFSEPWLLWLNTALLIMSSVALQWARVSADREQIDGVRDGLLAGGVCAFAFLAGQLMAWQLMVAQGYFASTNPAVAFFYLLTAMHAVHLLGGLVAWGRTTAKVRRGVDVVQLRLSVELCAIYWHFLLLVWLILFGLLLFT